MIEVNNTCPSPIRIATRPIVRISRRSSLSPATNSSRAMPILAIRSTSSLAATSPKPAGPTKMPTRINPTIIGCRRRIIRAPMTAAIINKTAIWENTSILSASIFFSYIRGSSINLPLPPVPLQVRAYIHSLGRADHDLPIGEFLLQSRISSPNAPRGNL